MLTHVFFIWSWRSWVQLLCVTCSGSRSGWVLDKQQEQWWAGTGSERLILNISPTLSSYPTALYTEITVSVWVIQLNLKCLYIVTQWSHCSHAVAPVWWQIKADKSKINFSWYESFYGYFIWPGHSSLSLVSYTAASLKWECTDLNHTLTVYHLNIHVWQLGSRCEFHFVKTSIGRGWGCIRWGPFSLYCPFHLDSLCCFSAATVQGKKNKNIFISNLLCC